jgi:hypothetical protein
LRALLTLVLFALLAACASNATITYSWVADDLHDDGRERQGVLVLAISREVQPRQRFERAFTDALLDRGIDAVASYELNGATEISREDVVAMAAERDLDTVLVTTFAGRDEMEVLHPGRTYYGVAPVYSPTGGYYGRGGVYGVPYEVAHVPDFYAQHKSLHLEANLYDVVDGKHLWQAAAGITETDDQKQMIDGFIAAYIDQMYEDLQVR